MKPKIVNSIKTLEISWTQMHSFMPCSAVLAWYMWYITYPPVFGIPISDGPIQISPRLFGVSKLEFLGNCVALFA